MRHRKDHRKLGRSPSHRKAMLRNLVSSLIEHEQVRTTQAKAKDVRRIAERMITLGKRGTLHARRHALRTLRGKQVAAKLFDTLSPRYKERSGGYTRVVKLGPRVGDSAEMAIVELLPESESSPSDKAS